MIQWGRLAADFVQAMNFNGDTTRGLAQKWEVAPMSIMNIRNGRTLTAEMFMRATQYIGANPLAYWGGPTGVDYSPLLDEE